MSMVEVLYDFDTKQPDELSLHVGNLIVNCEPAEDGWMRGELNGKKGIFPRSFVKIVPQGTTIASGAVFDVEMGLPEFTFNSSPKLSSKPFKKAKRRVGSLPSQATYKSAIAKPWKQPGIVCLETAPASEKVTKELFTSPLPNHLECEICLDVLNNPLITGCCGQSYCKDCIDRVMTMLCPHCCRNLETFPDKKSVRLINELEIKCCYYAENKCQWKGSPPAFTHHLKVCEFKLIVCPLGCGKQIEKKSVTAHTSKDCKLRKITCEHCHKQISYHNMTLHKTICSEMPISCVNQCSSTEVILRKDMDAHLNTCPSQLVTCEYFEFGCNQKMKRQDLQHHSSTSMEQHLFLVAESAKRERDARIALEQDVRQEIALLKAIIASKR